MLEYLSGTDPKDPQSVLKLSLSPAGENRVRLTWPLIAGKDYWIETADNQLDTFGRYRRVPNDSRLHVTPKSILDPAVSSGPGPEQRSYRLRLDAE